MSTTMYTMIKPSKILNRKLFNCQLLKSCSSMQINAEEKNEIHLSDFRTLESKPENHSLLHEGKFYTISPKIHQKLFTLGGFTKLHELQMKTFRENCLMVRRPALEIMNYLKNADYSLPAVRYVIYGRLGTGKSSTLAHVIHYALETNWLLLHVPYAVNWVRRCRDFAQSTRHAQRMDIPMDSALWLQNFYSQNVSLLQELDLRVSETYEWSKREITEEGEPLTKLVDLGVNRMKYASDCMAVLLKEIKQQSQTGKFRVLVVIDAVNSFFGPTKIKRPEDKSLVDANDVTPVWAFRKVLLNDWKNAAIVVTVDKLAGAYNEERPYMPFSSLGKEGIDCLEPFIPVLVENYTDKEIDSCIDYFIDRKWIQHENIHQESGRAELKFLSGHNPYYLMQLVAPL